MAIFNAFLWLSSWPPHTSSLNPSKCNLFTKSISCSLKNVHPSAISTFYLCFSLFLWLLINVYWSKGQYLHLILPKYRFKSWYRYSVRAWAGANLKRDQCPAPTLCWIYDESETYVQLARTRHYLWPLLWPWHWYDQAPVKCELHRTLPLWGWEWRTNAEPKAILITYFSTNLCQCTYRQQKNL